MFAYLLQMVGPQGLGARSLVAALRSCCQACHHLLLLCAACHVESNAIGQEKLAHKHVRGSLVMGDHAVGICALFGVPGPATTCC